MGGLFLQQQFSVLTTPHSYAQRNLLADIILISFHRLCGVRSPRYDKFTIVFVIIILKLLDKSESLVHFIMNILNNWLHLLNTSHYKTPPSVCVYNHILYFKFILIIYLLQILFFLKYAGLSGIIETLVEQVTLRYFRYLRKCMTILWPLMFLSLTKGSDGADILCVSFFKPIEAVKCFNMLYFQIVMKHRAAS